MDGGPPLTVPWGPAALRTGRVIRGGCVSSGPRGTEHPYAAALLTRAFGAFRRGSDREERRIVRKTLLLGGLAGAVALLVRSQQQDIMRYLKIKQMSMGEGHPENVPAGGSRKYPAPGMGAPDGTGDFDSARRGGLESSAGG
jgi:hypothetical protein